VREIELKRLDGEKVDGDRVAAEGVEHEHVILLGLVLLDLATQREPRVAEFYVASGAAGAAIAQEREPAAAVGNLDDGRIDFIKVDGVLRKRRRVRGLSWLPRSKTESVP
jgi:hypothetical protein